MKFKDDEKVVVSSLDVAEVFGKEHRRVLQDIRELSCSDDFRLHGFVQSTYTNEQNRKQPMYYMTRDGFTLLVMGYSGEKAMQFKEAYIKQFNAMEKALQGKIHERIKGMAVRNLLTDAIKESRENERMHGHAYSTYTNVIYKSLFGKNASQLRKDLDLKTSDKLRDHLNAEELKAVLESEALVSGLIARGLSYADIKGLIESLPSPDINLLGSDEAESIDN